jgi:hypothetical protein
VAAITLVQHKATTVATSNAFANPQSSGNLNVVRIIYRTTDTLTSVTDDQGNGPGGLYALAVSFSDATDAIVCAIYYAANIAAHATGNTVKLNGTIASPDIFIQEYSGCDTVNPLGPVNHHLGSGTAVDAGSLITTVNNAVLMALFWVVGTYNGNGSGWTPVDSPNGSGNGTEDRVVSSINTYTTPATQDTNGAVLGVSAAFQASPVPTPRQIIITPAVAW